MYPLNISFISEMNIQGERKQIILNQLVCDTQLAFYSFASTCIESFRTSTAAATQVELNTNHHAKK
jgi:hypothetical protein